MEEEKTVGLVETFDTGELSTELIPPNFTDPDDLFEILKKTVSSYHPSNDLEMINKAYELAKDAHKDQKRTSSGVSISRRIAGVHTTPTTMTKKPLMSPTSMQVWVASETSSYWAAP